MWIKSTCSRFLLGNSYGAVGFCLYVFSWLNFVGFEADVYECI